MIQVPSSSTTRNTTKLEFYQALLIKLKVPLITLKASLSNSKIMSACTIFCSTETQ